MQWLCHLAFWLLSLEDELTLSITGLEIAIVLQHFLVIQIFTFVSINLHITFGHEDIPTLPSTLVLHNLLKIAYFDRAFPIILRMLSSNGFTFDAWYNVRLFFASIT